MNTAQRLTTATIALAIAAAGTLQMTASPAPATAEVTPSTQIEAEILDTPAIEPIDHPALVVVNADERQAEMIADAFERFEAAGLQLPPVEIEFSEDRELCDGNAGMYRPRSARDPQLVDKIDICSKVRTILLHELGHAWERHAVTDETRQAFLDHWGLDAWFDRDDDWHERGIEMAAETIAYSLFIKEPVDADHPFFPYLCGYELLTGGQAPAAVAATPCEAA